MREIKFRAWDTYDNKWRYFAIGQAFGTLGESLYKSLCLDGATFYQFTGLKDKHGKEIYEGDRLKDSGGYTWIVFWYDDHACFGVRSEVNSVGSEIIDNVNMEVVGNIYENNSQ